MAAEPYLVSVAWRELKYCKFSFWEANSSQNTSPPPPPSHSAFHQVSLTISRYPFILLDGDRHCFRRFLLKRNCGTVNVTLYLASHSIDGLQLTRMNNGHWGPGWLTMSLKSTNVACLSVNAAKLETKLKRKFNNSEHYLVLSTCTLFWQESYQRKC